MSRHPFSGERLYVGNLPYDVTEREVDELFYKVCLHLTWALCHIGEDMGVSLLR